MVCSMWSVIADNWFWAVIAMALRAIWKIAVTLITSPPLLELERRKVKVLTELVATQQQSHDQERKVWERSRDVCSDSAEPTLILPTTLTSSEPPRSSNDSDSESPG